MGAVDGEGKVFRLANGPMHWKKLDIKFFHAAHQLLSRERYGDFAL